MTIIIIIIHKKCMIIENLPSTQNWPHIQHQLYSFANIIPIIIFIHFLYLQHKHTNKNTFWNPDHINYERNYLNWYLFVDSLSKPLSLFWSQRESTPRGRRRIREERKESAPLFPLGPHPTLCKNLKWSMHAITKLVASCRGLKPGSAALWHVCQTRSISSARNQFVIRCNECMVKIL